MKVKELIKKLRQQDPERIVILSKDIEGNGFCTLEAIVMASYEEEYPGSGRIGPEVLTPELKKQGYTEEDIVHGAPAIVLWP